MASTLKVISAPLATDWFSRFRVFIGKSTVRKKRRFESWCVKFSHAPGDRKGDTN